MSARVKTFLPSRAYGSAEDAANDWLAHHPEWRAVTISTADTPAGLAITLLLEEDG